MRIRAHVKLVFCALAFAWLNVNVARAASVVEPSDSTIDYYRELDETTVTAAKPLRKIGTSTPTFSLSGSDVLHTGITDISDALHRLPGVVLRDYGGSGGLKTVSVRGLGAAHTTVVYDGLPLSDAQSGAIDLSRYTVDNAGDLSLIIGDNTDLLIPARMAAAPATLSLTTKTPPSSKEFDFTARFKIGSFGYYSPYVDATTRLSESVTFNVNGEFVHALNNYPFKWTNGEVTTRERRANSRMNSGHGEANISWDYRNGSFLKAKAYFYDNSRQLPGPVMYYIINASQEHLRERNAFGQVSFNHNVNTHWNVNGGAKFNWAASLYTDPGNRQAGNVLHENYFQREAYVTANVLFTPSRAWSIDYAADYFFNSLNSNLTTDIRPRRNSILQSLTVKWSIPRLNITARVVESIYLNSAGEPGARYPRNRNRLSPSLSLSARLLNNGLLYGRLSYKNIFRMPTFNEAYFKHYGAADLKPESTDQLDLGLTCQLSRSGWLPVAVLTADVYRNWVSDRIVAVPYNMFVWTVTNVERVVATGADITLNTTFDLGRRQAIVTTGTWSYQRSKIDVEKTNAAYGKQVAYTPLNSGSFSIGYENPWVNVVIHGQGVSARYADNLNSRGTRLPGYFEFGMTLWREIGIGKSNVELRIDALNILDKQYSVIARYPMPGRSWQFSIKYNI